MTEQSEALVEELATVVHGALSKANVMAYLDMPLETAGDVARAILPIIEAREAAGKEQAERMAEALLEVVGCFEAAIEEGWQDKCHELSTEPGEIGDLVVRRINWAYGAASDALAAWEESRG